MKLRVKTTRFYDRMKKLKIMSPSLPRFAVISFILSSMIVQSADCELVVLRRVPNNDQTTRDLTCISEDDGAALVWNYNSDISVVGNGHHGSTDFNPKIPRSNNSVTDCAIWGSTRCMAKWGNNEGWGKVNAAEKPMGPVFDYRWEDFRKFVFEGSSGPESYEHVVKMKENSDTVVFSARGTQAVSIYLCGNKDASKGRCLWITLGGGTAKRSSIWSCDKGTLGGSPSPGRKQCTIVANSTDGVGAVIDEYEWRTFTLKWSSDRKMIQVFRDDDRGDKPFLSATLHQWDRVSHILLRRTMGSRIRFHFYDYYLTEKPGSKLSTREFPYEGEDFCVELPVGLCPGCRVNVYLMDEIGNRILSGTSGDRDSVHNEVLRWQRVKLKWHNGSSKKLKLEIEILPNSGGEGKWAISSFRTCRPDDGSRESTVTIRSKASRWPKVKCQKLSHDKIDVVDSSPPAMIRNETPASVRFAQRWIKSCARPSCPITGENWSACDSVGCTCNPIFQGADCKESASCFGVVPGETYLTLTRSSDPDKCESYKLGTVSLEVYSATGKSDGTIIVPSFPHYIKERAPNTKYKITIYGTKMVKLWDTVVHTLESAPGKVRNVQSKDVTDKTVTLMWDEPSVKNGVIRSYIVSVKRTALIGCEKSGDATPAEPAISKSVEGTTTRFENLHPYARYTATVTAQTTKPGLAESLEFTTKAATIPTSVVSNLKYDAIEKQLTWDGPTDCTTISGPVTGSKLFFTSSSEWRAYWTTGNETTKRFFDVKSLDLVAYTTYRVRVHVDRNGNTNPNLYKETVWTTPASAPPEVRNLTIFDADPKKKGFSLLWKAPYPPHGVIESYHVAIIKNGKASRNWAIKASDGIPKSDVWGDYICFENQDLRNVAEDIEVQVYAKNVNVTSLGVKEQIPFNTSDYYNRAPGEPSNLKEIFPGHGVVILVWGHPFASTKIERFDISVTYVNTSLEESTSIVTVPISKNYPVDKKRKEYSQELNLSPSTLYSISIKSTYQQNGQNRSSLPETRIITVPDGFGFIGERKLHHEILDETLIELKIPPIINATGDTMVNVNVYGSLTCSNRKLTGINKSEYLAAKYNTNENKTRTVRIGKNHTNAENLECYPSPNENYTIKVAIVNQSGEILAIIAEYPIGPAKTDLSLVWLVVLPILLIWLLPLIIWRRKLIKAFRQRRTETKSSPKTKRFVNEKKSMLFSNLNENRLSDHIYAVPYDSDTRFVSTEYFPTYAKNAANGGLLLSQYIMFPRGLTKPCKYGQLPQNMAKNRDKNSIAYDDTRVVLQKIPDDPHSDYINASYIQGHRGEKAFIATQGPMPNTVNDFWRMIWQEKVYVICMLTNVTEDGKIKCEKYWPEVGVKVKYGEVSVLNTGHQVFADYTIRSFRLCCQKYKRKITQLHYTEWPDNRIPTYFQSLVLYLRRLDETPSGNGPVVVHCDTGDGRTGTLLLCHICLRQGVETKAIDVLAVTNRMRESRADMVGNQQQYLLAHVVIAESITASITQLPCDDDLPKRIKKLRRQLPSDIQRLADTVWQDRVLYSLITPRCPTPGDFARKRLPELDSISPDVIHFERYSNSDERSGDYVTTVSVDGVRAKKEFLASQLPSKSTWSKFWTLIAQKNIELVIVLQGSDPNDPTCCNLIPRDQTFSPVPWILVEPKRGLCEGNSYTLEEFSLTVSSEDKTKPQSVTVLTCTGWKEGKNGKPPSPAALVSLWRASGKIPRKENPSLVLCHDGITGCGLYLALSFLLERMSLERECDVISAVRAVRRFRPEFVESTEQFEYLYDAAVDYIECFQTYANFT